MRATLSPSARATDGGDLGDLERVRQPSALMIVGEHEHLRLAGEPAERAGVQDAIAVAFEARAPRIGQPRRWRASRRRSPVVADGASALALGLLAVLAVDERTRSGAGPRIGVGEGDRRRRRDRASSMPSARARSPDVGHPTRVPNNSGWPFGIAR